MQPVTITYAPPAPDAETTPSFMGRNGFFHTSGIRISQPVPSIIALEPVTTKGKVGRCVIEIPARPEVIREVIGALHRLAGVDSKNTAQAFFASLLEEFPGFTDDSEVDGADLVDFIDEHMSTITKIVEGA